MTKSNNYLILKLFLLGISAIFIVRGLLKTPRVEEREMVSGEPLVVSGKSVSRGDAEGAEVKEEEDRGQRTEDSESERVSGEPLVVSSNMTEAISEEFSRFSGFVSPVTSPQTAISPPKDLSVSEEPKILSVSEEPKILSVSEEPSVVSTSVIVTVESDVPDAVEEKSILDILWPDPADTNIAPVDVDELMQEEPIATNQVETVTEAATNAVAVAEVDTNVVAVAEVDTNVVAVVEVDTNVIAVAEVPVEEDVIDEVEMPTNMQDIAIGAIPIVIEKATTRGRIVMLEDSDHERYVVKDVPIAIWYIDKDGGETLIFKTRTDDDGMFSLPEMKVGIYRSVIGKTPMLLQVVPVASKLKEQERAAPKALLILMPKEAI